MSIFEYMALDRKGRERKGFVDTAGASVAIQKLREKGIYPVEIHQAQEKKSSSLTGALEIGFLERFSAKEVSVFTR